MDIIIKLNEQTAGRDRMVRLLQYGSRAYWYYAKNIRTTQHSAEILRSLEYTFSSFRKCTLLKIFKVSMLLALLPIFCSYLFLVLRLGRCLDSFYSALKMMNYPNLTVRVTLTLSKIANALFLLADHIIWVGRVGLFKVNIEKWSKVANKYWLMTIILNLTRDVYEITKILEREGKDILKKTPSVSSSICKQCIMLSHLVNHKEIIMDTVKNGCDLFIPLTTLGFTKFTPGTIGLFGVISSIVGLYTLIDPFYKLTPA